MLASTTTLLCTWRTLVHGTWSRSAISMIGMLVLSVSSGSITPNSWILHRISLYAVLCCCRLWLDRCSFSHTLFTCFCRWKKRHPYRRSGKFTARCLQISKAGWNESWFVCDYVTVNSLSCPGKLLLAVHCTMGNQQGCQLCQGNL
jgi:hypothetical protein